MSVGEVGSGGWEWERPTLCLRTLGFSLYFSRVARIQKVLCSHRHVANMGIGSQSSATFVPVSSLRPFMEKGLQLTAADRMSLQIVEQAIVLSPCPQSLPTDKHRDVWKMLNVLNLWCLKKGQELGVVLCTYNAHHLGR